MTGHVITVFVLKWKYDFTMSFIDPDEIANTSESIITLLFQEESDFGLH